MAKALHDLDVASGDVIARLDVLAKAIEAMDHKKSAAA